MPKNTRHGRRWLFYSAVAASWLFGAEIVVLTAARKSLPGHLPAFAGWLFFAAVGVSVVALTRLEVMGRQRANALLEQLEEALRSITALTEASLSSLELPELLDGFLERLVKVLHTEFGAIMVLDDSGTVLRPIASRGTSAEVREPFEVKIFGSNGLFSRVVVTELPIATVDDVDITALGKRIRQHLISAAACPVLVEGRLIGVCVAATGAEREFDEREMHLLQLVADRSGLGIERQRLDEAERRSLLEAEQAHRYAVVLAASSAALGTARDEYESNLFSLVDVIVPAFSDWCAIDLLRDSGELERLAIRHSSLQGDRPSDELLARVALIDEASSRVLRLGYPQTSPAFIEPAASKSMGSAGEATEDTSPWISVPIVTNTGVLGAITFAFDEWFSLNVADTVATAEDIGRRAGTAIDRVQFYQEAQEIAAYSSRIADQLQQLLGATHEVSTRLDAVEVITVIAERALVVCNASGAAVSLAGDLAPGIRAIAEQDESIRVGNLGIYPTTVSLPESISAPQAVQNIDGVLLAPITDAIGLVIGSVAIWRGGGVDFAIEDEMVLDLLAQTASTALANVALYREIQEREARWRTLIETAPIGIIEVDTTGALQWSNQFAHELFGADGDGLRKDHLVETIGRANVTQLEVLWSRARDGSGVRDLELNSVSPGGEKRDLVVSVVPLGGSSDEIRGILTLVADISDRRRLEDDLQQAQRMEAVGQLAGNVAHDFNNLLTLISGYTELLRAHDSIDRRQLDLVENIQGVADRAALLTGRLLTISRRQISRPQDIDPAESLEALREVLDTIVGERVALEYDLDHEAGCISIDPTYFDQMMLNLAVNARDAMPEGGTLAIALRRGARPITAREPGNEVITDSVELVVTDTGVGMDETTLARCFEPFFTTKGPSKGTGLGLAAVRGVIIESGGVIEVESTPRVGTTFRIKLPWLARVSPAEPSISPSARPEEVTILVAEDDATLRALIVRVLRQARYRVISAEAGDVALEAAESARDAIDLLVTDVTMPGMSGPELVRHLAQSSPGTAVLYISSNLGEAATLVIGKGYNAFLPKPFRPSELLARVAEIVSLRSQSDGVPPVR